MDKRCISATGDHVHERVVYAYAAELDTAVNGHPAFEWVFFCVIYLCVRVCARVCDIKTRLMQFHTHTTEL
eukprot:COSAG06_NODE_11041_length_1577_cov_2.134641_3_plen_71_part_00